MARNDGNASRNRKLGIRKSDKVDSFEKFVEEFNREKRGNKQKEKRKKIIYK